MNKSGCRLGFTTVTFRQKSIPEIIETARKNEIRYIEWGADVHAKSEGDAQLIRALCDKNGITSISLGSYCRIGDGDLDAFRRDCVIADIIGARRVRVWLGRCGSEDTTDETRKKFIAETREMARIAREYGIVVAFEFHRKTLTDTGASCAAFIRDVGEPNVRTYWQPFFEGNDKENLDAVADSVAAVHVFSWDAECHRFPLSDKEAEWRGFIEKVRSHHENIDFILEFVKDDSDEQFKKDVEMLKKLLK